MNNTNGRYAECDIWTPLATQLFHRWEKMCYPQHMRQFGAGVLEWDKTELKVLEERVYEFGSTIHKSDSLERKLFISMVLLIRNMKLQDSANE